MKEHGKSSHKKNSKSCNSENLLEYIIKGLSASKKTSHKNETIISSIIKETSKSNMKLNEKCLINTLNIDKQDIDQSIFKEKTSSNSPAILEERKDDEYLKDKLIKLIKESFRTRGHYPQTTLDFYRLVKMIGKGAFGKVFLGVHLLTGKYVAVKSIEKKYIKEESSQKRIFQEVYILKKINHQNVIRLLEVFENKRYLFLVLEYAPKGDLLKYVKKKTRLEEDVAKEIFAQIVSGLRHCHRNLILHRDVKLDNVLLDKNNKVKICDFGVSRFVKKGQTIKEQCGTPAYIAPEIIKDKGYEGCYADIWSLGVLLYAIVTGSVPFKADNIEDLHKVILKGKYIIPNYVSESCKDLIRKMLQLNPYNRISIEAIGSHSWFDKGPEFGRRESMYDGQIRNSIFDGEHRRTHSMDKNCKKNTIAEVEPASVIRILEPILQKVEGFGYSREFVIQSINSNSCNHASVSYYLLYEEFQGEKC